MRRSRPRRAPRTGGRVAAARPSRWRAVARPAAATAPPADRAPGPDRPPRPQSPRHARAVPRRTRRATAPGRRRPGWPRCGLVLAGAAIVLAGTVGGWAVTRVLAGQSPLSTAR